MAKKTAASAFMGELSGLPCVFCNKTENTLSVSLKDKTMSAVLCVEHLMSLLRRKEGKDKVKEVKPQTQPEK